MSIDIELQYDRIYRYCHFRLHDGPLAEDVTQETFLRYFERGPCLTDDAALKYLYTIARNLCINCYRKNAAVPPEVPMPDSQSEDSLLTNLTVRQAISALCEADRELLLLRYVNEVPLGVMAKILGISRFAVYRRLRAAEAHFRNRLKKEGYDESHETSPA